MKARQWKITLVFVTLALAGLSTLPVLCLIGSEALKDQWNRRTFDADLWKRQELTKDDPHWPPRLCMADDLLASRRLFGRTEAQVAVLLGTPTHRMIIPGTTKCEVSSYYLGPERGPFGIDSEILRIAFGADGKVNRQWIHRD